MVRKKRGESGEGSESQEVGRGPQQRYPAERGAPPSQQQGGSQGGRGYAPQGGRGGGYGGGRGRGAPQQQYGGAPEYHGRGRGGGGGGPSHHPGGRSRGSGGGGMGGGRGGGPSYGGPQPQAPELHQATTVPYHTGVTPQPAAFAEASSSSYQPSEEVTPMEVTPMEITPSEPASPVPPSSKSVRFPLRPGKGSYGTRCVVKANHFFAELPNKDLHQYDVSNDASIAGD